MYVVKEIFKTLQGEGMNVGRPAVFVRFAGCNLWSGREEDRATATCQFCDTDFVGGERYEIASLVERIGQAWDNEAFRGRFIVFSGGEPLLQLDEPLIEACLEAHFRIAVETNGTIAVPRRVQHLTVSPKAGTDIVQRDADELKFIFPQEGMSPEEALDLVKAPVNYIQPMDGQHRSRNTNLAIAYCMQHPWWRLSLQTHKILGLP